MPTRRSILPLLSSCLLLTPVMIRSAFSASTQSAPQPSPTGGPGMEMLTIFLRHDETKTLDEINQHLKSTGWYKDFPPPGVEVISWYVLMGVGQVVTLRFPAEKLRDINQLIEKRRPLHPVA